MKLTILSCAAALLGGAATAQSADDVFTKWATADGGAHVEITDCGDGTPCGNMVWYDDSEATTDRDINNPDKSLRERALLGLQLVWGFKLKGDEWRSGKVYDPEVGRVYRAKLSPQDDGTLKLTGCFGPICRSQVWTRVSAE